MENKVRWKLAQGVGNRLPVLDFILKNVCKCFFHLEQDFIWTVLSPSAGKIETRCMFMWHPIEFGSLTMAVWKCQRGYLYRTCSWGQGCCGSGSAGPAAQPFSLLKSSPRVYWHMAAAADKALSGYQWRGTGAAAVCLFLDQKKCLKTHSQNCTAICNKFRQNCSRNSSSVNS